jgi:pantothenate kinase-related protein Tda10
MEERLNGMRYSKNARFNIEKTCLPGTQTAVLDEVLKWVSAGQSSDGDDPHPSIFLLHGLAGTGKSTIANTVATQLHAMGRLGASFCFSRNDQTERNEANMFSTIARSIAYLDQCFMVKLAQAIKDPSLCSSGLQIAVTHEQY